MVDRNHGNGHPTRKKRTSWRSHVEGDEARPAEARPAEARPAEARPAEARPAEADAPDDEAEDEADDHGRDDDDSSNAQQPTKPFYKRPITWIAAGVVLIAAIGGFVYWLHARHYESTDDAFIDGHVVQIAAKVPGYVDRLNINDNQLVQKGDVLLEIDARDYRLAVDRARAAESAATERLKQADAQISAAQAQAKAAEAEVTAAAATATNAAQQQKRNAHLSPVAVSRETFENSIAAASSASAQESAARERVAAAEAQIDLARAQRASTEAALSQAKVEVGQAELNLSYCQVVAPMTGRITHRGVERGDYAQPGVPLFALVDPNVWVTANFKETQLTDMHIGQLVDVTVDAFPGVTLHAHVDSFQRGSGARFSLLPAENATGNFVKIVQRVPVKIVFDEPPPERMILGPGMSVEPQVTVR